MQVQTETNQSKTRGNIAFGTERIEAIIGITFKNKELLRRAFVHRSLLNENRGTQLTSWVCCAIVHFGKS